jgi:hypothetical protein
VFKRASGTCRRGPQGLEAARGEFHPSSRDRGVPSSCNQNRGVGTHLPSSDATYMGPAQVLADTIEAALVCAYETNPQLNA